MRAVPGVLPTQARRAGLLATTVFAVLAAAVLPASALATTRSVSTTGADNSACAAQPCKTFSYAYKQSAPGDVVEVAGGTYPEQAIPVVAGRAAPAVEFRPAAGAAVTLNDIRIQGDHVTIRGIRLGYAWIDKSGGDVVGTTIAGGSGPGMYIGGVRDFLLKGGDYGPVVNTPIITIGGGTGITFDGVDLHDATAPAGSDAHLECIYAASPQHFTVRNSIFRNCAYFDIFFTKLGGPDPKDVLLENNIFEQTYTDGHSNAPYALNVSNWLSKMENFTIRNNTFGSAIAIQPTTIVGSRFSNNIGPDSPCNSGLTFSHNIWADGTCSPTDKKVAGVMSQFLDPAGHDWHLKAGAAAIGFADPADAPTLDRDGYARVGAADAGAHEYGAAPPVPPCDCPGGAGSGAPGTPAATTPTPAAAAGNGTLVSAPRALAGTQLPGSVAPLRRIRVSGVTLCRHSRGSCEATVRVRVWLTKRAALALRVRRFDARGRLHTARTVRRAGRQGENLLRIRGTGLRAGRYRLVVTARPPGGTTSAPVTLGLRVR